MARRLLPALAVACAAAAIAGCGGGSGIGRRAPGGSQGHELFAQACGACHSLNGHENPRKQGGDLLGFHSTRPQMLQLAGEMPVRHPLSRSQLEAVVSFVMSVEAQNR